MVARVERLRSTRKDDIFIIFRFDAKGLPMSGAAKILPLFENNPWKRGLGGRASTLSSRIVAEVRAAVLEGKLAAGTFLGTEKDIAERAGVSRIAARDALRTLQAMGVVEIKVGAGGGARIADGNPALFSEALAVQLSLAGVTAREMVDAQRGIECLAAELAAENATPDDLARIRRRLDEAETVMGDAAAYTSACLAFHLAIAEASHNRVLVAQLLSLQHVSWPAENRTLTPAVARHVHEVHVRLADLIECRDAAAARRLMDEHVKMIRTRRASDDPSSPQCC